MSGREVEVTGKTTILDFLSTYPSLLTDAEEKVANAKKRLTRTDEKFVPIAEKELQKAENGLRTLQLQHDEYHQLLRHFSLLPEEDIQHAIQFLKSYSTLWAEAKTKEFTAEKFLEEVKTSSLSRADMVEDFRKRYVDSYVKRKMLEKKAFAMGELLRYANYR